MRATLFALLFLSLAAQAADCVTYVGVTAITGRLKRLTFAEQPNYESVARGDAAATYFFVKPTRPICVAAGNNANGLEPAEAEVPMVQLVFADGKRSYRQLRPYLGQSVICQGSLFHAITGHHQTAVLLSDANCYPTSTPTRRHPRVQTPSRHG